MSAVAHSNCILTFISEFQYTRLSVNTNTWDHFRWNCLMCISNQQHRNLNEIARCMTHLTETSINYHFSLSCISVHRQLHLLLYFWMSRLYYTPFNTFQNMSCMTKSNQTAYWIVFRNKLWFLCCQHFLSKILVFCQNKRQIVIVPLSSHY